MLQLSGQAVDQALIAALCSEEGDEADGVRGVTSGRIELRQIQ